MHVQKNGMQLNQIHSRKLTWIPKWWFGKGNSLNKLQFLVSILDVRCLGVQNYWIWLGQWLVRGLLGGGGLPILGKLHLKRTVKARGLRKILPTNSNCQRSREWNKCQVKMTPQIQINLGHFNFQAANVRNKLPILKNHLKLAQKVAVRWATQGS